MQASIEVSSKMKEEENKEVVKKYIANKLQWKM